MYSCQARHGEEGKAVKSHSAAKGGGESVETTFRAELPARLRKNKASRAVLCKPTNETDGRTKFVTAQIGRGSLQGNSSTCAFRHHASTSVVPDFLSMRAAKNAPKMQPHSSLPLSAQLS